METNIPETFRNREMIQYNDGQLVLAYRQPGDDIVIGSNSIHKYAREITGDSLIMITTKSGNSYFLGEGLILNEGTGKCGQLSIVDSFDIKIGERAILGSSISDCAWRTTPITGVYLNYKSAQPNYKYADQQIDTPSPFTGIIPKLRAHLLQQNGFTR